jgi:hypothetical protein
MLQDVLRVLSLCALLHDDVIVTFFGSLSLRKEGDGGQQGALTLLHFFYTWFVLKLGVLADNFSADSLCGGGVVWRKCEEKDGPRVLEGGWIEGKQCSKQGMERREN